MKTTPISIEVSGPGVGKSYLPLGCNLRAIHAETGEPLDLIVTLDRGELIAHAPEPDMPQGATP